MHGPRSDHTSPELLMDTNHELYRTPSSVLMAPQFPPCLPGECIYYCTLAADPLSTPSYIHVDGWPQYDASGASASSIHCLHTSRLSLYRSYPIACEPFARAPLRGPRLYNGSLPVRGTHTPAGLCPIRSTMACWDDSEASPGLVPSPVCRFP
jgi:hypothetical protein